MMRVAFYAPLKAPDHPIASGDRQIARAFFELLGRVGHDPFLACRLRSFDGRGDPLRQQRLATLGAKAALRIEQAVRAGRLPRPDLWFTYHPYYKAPDHLGPRLAAAFGVPYVVAECSIAPRRADGPWASGHRASLLGLRAADVALALTEQDRLGLEAALGSGERVWSFPPFLDLAPFATSTRAAERSRWSGRLGLDPSVPWLLAVAMMRDDVKRQSYEQLAKALLLCARPDWQLVLVGDGPARARIEALFARLPIAAQTRFAGFVERRLLPGLYAACDLFVWPALNEAYCVALLEAQAAGLPVIAGREGGVCDVVADGIGGLLVEAQDPQAIAAAVDELLHAPERRAAMGERARSYIRGRHGIETAQARLRLALDAALRAHPRAQARRAKS
jgi:glycosyltransferase involved in cell wall biosynthesis